MWGSDTQLGADEDSRDPRRGPTDRKRGDLVQPHVHPRKFRDSLVTADDVSIAADLCVTLDEISEHEDEHRHQEEVGDAEGAAGSDRFEVGSSKRGARPPKSTVAIPIPTAPIPSVTMNEGMRNRTLSTPFTIPKAVPARMPKTTAPRPNEDRFGHWLR